MPAIFIPWTVKFVEARMEQSFATWGLYPRTFKGLLGILTMPFLHSDTGHLFANTVGIFIMGLLLLQYYEKVALKVLIHATLWSGVLVWIFARPAFHIGASALIYGLSSFLFFSGLLRKDRKSMGAALVVTFLYGASVWGVLPLERGISWEGHLCGAISGAVLALSFRSVDLPPRYLEDDEEKESENQDPVSGAWTGDEIDE